MHNSIRSEDNILLMNENIGITDQNNKNNKYKSGLFSYMIKSLIKFFSYMFVNFFAVVGFLPLDEDQIRNLLIKKEKVKE